MSNLVLGNLVLLKGNLDQKDWKHLLQLFKCTFLGIYALLLVTDGYYFLISLMLGFGYGALYFSNSESRLLSFEYKKYDTEPNEDPLYEDSLELYNRPLQGVINQLLDCFMSEFISSWWKQLNIYNDTQFEKATREKLNKVCIQVEKVLMNQDKNDIVMSTLYGLANTLIIHMRECREFEDSEISIEDYGRRNPQSPFAQLLTKKDQHRELRALSQTLLKRALVGVEKESDLLTTLLKELLATFLWGNLLDIVSDPDFLNCMIIDLLSDKEITTVAKATTAVAEEVVKDFPATLVNNENRAESTEEEVFFSPNSVHFTVMDISAPQSAEHPLNKSQMCYIIQIERSNIDLNAGSEGGGYVITRSYTDFETFHTILVAHHAKRAVKIQLRLPLDPAKSWLKQQPAKRRTDPISGDLEAYLNKVVRDPELGANPIISAFLRKERRSQVMSDDVVTFSEEFKEQLVAAFAFLTESKNNPTVRTRSLFSRNSSSKTLSELSVADIKRKRKDSVSSLTSPEAYSGASSSSTDEDPEIVKSPVSEISSKSLSSMDVELLIETTYALVIEIFNLTPSNNKAWMRRSILNILREIVRRSYTEFISEQYNDLLNAHLSLDAIRLRLNQVGQQVWPDNKWDMEEKKQVSKEYTQIEREENKRKAKVLLMNRVIPSAVRQLIGDQNCDTAMDRIWSRIQDPILNRVLMLQLLERIVKSILG
ncbi:PXA domain-containing protein [Sporodiniella umbellata]|nr:PXA domain-containing protein [Sporodiniella umbellata]